MQNPARFSRITFKKIENNTYQKLLILTIDYLEHRYIYVHKKAVNTHLCTIGRPFLISCVGTENLVLNECCLRKIIVLFLE